MTRKAKHPSAAHRGGLGLSGPVRGRRAFATPGIAGDSGGSGASSPRLAAILVLAASVFLIVPAAASADITRNLVGSFGSFSEPHAIAVDRTSGDVYVADTGNHRVEKFDEEGHLLLGFGAEVGGSGIDLCTTACGPGRSGSGPGEFTEAEFLAVDNSGGASAGDVYVGDPGDNRVSKYTSSGTLVASQLDGSTTTAGSFGSVGGIAVDSSGVLYVLNTTLQVFKFEQDGTFAGELTAGQLSVTPDGLAVGGSGELFKEGGDGSVEEFAPTGRELGPVAIALPTRPGANAFDLEPGAAGLFVVTKDDRLDHYVFNGTGEVVEPGGTFCALSPGTEGCLATDSASVGFAGTGIAISPASGDALVSDPITGQVEVYEQVTIPAASTGAATEVHAATATLSGTVKPEGIEVAECFFEWGTEAGVYGHVAQCEPAAAAIPTAGETQVEARLTGLTAGTTYHYRLVVANANDQGHAPNPGADETLSTLPTPTIDEATSEKETAHSATLTGKIDPQGFATHYRFEYGPDTSYGTVVPVPDGTLGPETEDIPVSVEATGLSANVTYHWRLVAESANGAAETPDHTFIFLTEPPPGPVSCPNAAFRTGPSADLPDCRAYEMITPPAKNGALIGDVAFVGGIPSIAANGERVIASSIQCFAEAESCNAQHGDGVGSPYSFTRTATGWVTEALAPPATRFPVNTPWRFDADSSVALFSMATPPAGEDDFYRREPDGSFIDVGPNTPIENGALGPRGGFVAGIDEVWTPDFSHLVWQAGTTGTHEHWPFDSTPPGAQSVYEYAGTGNTHPLLVGVTGGRGSNDLISECGTHIGPASNTLPPGPISADGRIVFFTALANEGECTASAPTVAELYARVDGELPDAHTVAVSEPEESNCGTGSGAGEVSCLAAASEPAPAGFRGASEDGRLAYFVSTQELTDDATEDSNPGTSNAAEEGGCIRVQGTGCNLYLYDLGEPAGHDLIDVSTGDVDGGGPQVKGVVAVSADGSHIYFVAGGVLATNKDALGEEARPGTDNLYVWQRDGAALQGRTSFIGDLIESDHEEWLGDSEKPANVTPEGQFLVFRSHADLTPDDTSRSGAYQIFRYDADSGRLLRLSIGRRGFNDDGNRSAPGLCGTNGVCSEDALIAQGHGNLWRRDPTMSNDGSRVFFQSPVALTPGALDDKRIGENEEQQIPVYAENVYEWEQQGTHDCTEAGGCIALLSDGQDLTLDNGNDPLCPLSSSCLLGTDAKGENVFISTAVPLVGSDADTEVDYYDVRVDGGFAEPPAPVPCESSEGCHGPGTSPAAPQTHGTAGFDGPSEGPATAPAPKCKRGQAKKQGKCVTRKSKKHHKPRKHHGRKTRKHRRAGSDHGGGK